MICIFIAPHERAEAIEAYRDRLSQEQVDQIESAPEGATLLLMLALGGDRKLNSVKVQP